MGVVYIGDRGVGKTALATELINPKFDYVNISNQSYDNLKRLLFDEEEETFKPTDVDPVNVVSRRFLEIDVKLPAGLRTIEIDWLDTPGEIWRKSWQADNPEQWQKVLSILGKSEGIMLILPPYREMVEFIPNMDIGQLPTLEQWCNRFQRWVDFFHYDCPKVRHIVICLNKADLFCNIEKEGFELAYNPQRSRKNWYQRHSYILQRYFRPVSTSISEISSLTSSAPVRCFITSIYQRQLLELPWIYLGSHLAS